MPLQGSLGPLGLAEVLQTGLAGRNGGNLVLRRGVHRAVLHVGEEGIFLYEPDPLDPEEIVQAFVTTQGIPPEDVAQARKEAPGGVALLDRLVETGRIPQQEVTDLLARAAEDLIVDLLTWREGDFRFEEGAAPPPGSGLCSRVCVDTGTLLLRAAQRMDEREAIQECLGSHPALFLVQDPGAFTGSETDPQAAVLALLDGVAVVDEIALRSGLGRFTTLKSIFDLVEAGVVRKATAEELSAAVDARVAASQWRVARSLCLQWAENEPHEAAPYEKMAAVAVARRNDNEEADALTQLGRVHLAAGQAREAAETFRRAVAKRSHDLEALSALREAARAAGDEETFEQTSLELAEESLQNDDAERAAALLGELPPGTRNTLAVRVLRARALLRLKDRIAVVAEVEAILPLLGTKCRKKAERDAASFCRDAIAHCAPERSDLLRQFRALAEGTRVRSRRAAILVALAAVVACAGWVLWPKGAAAYLEEAAQALARGDAATADELVNHVLAEWPDAPEAEEARALQAKIHPARTPNGPATGPVDPALRKQLEASLPEWLKAIRTFPQPASRDALLAVADLLEKPGGLGLRPAVLRPLSGALGDAVRATVVDIRVRTDALGMLRAIAGAGRRAKPEALREAIREAEAYMADDLPARLETIQPLVVRVGKLDPGDGYLRGLSREVEQSAKALSAARTSYQRDLEECRRLLATHELEQEYTVCREQAPKLLVAGRLDDADALYAKLEQRLQAFDQDAVLRSVHESAVRRQIPQFVRERRGVVAEIRQGMAAAVAAEEAGDLAAAVQTYAGLAKRFWMVRFENVFSLPLRVETVPAGARVALNGEDAGTTPVTVRYRWGSSTTLTLESPGFEVMTEVLKTAEEQPRSSIDVHLVPKVRWSAPVDAGVSTRPVEVGEDLLAVDRTGRLTLHEGRDGRVSWTRQIRSLEGIRHRAAAVPGLIAVPFVDGRLHFVGVRDGAVLEVVEIGRPAGDAASVDAVLAVPTVQRTLLGYRGRKPAFTAALSGDVTAGALAAHGAFWVGTAGASLDRVDAGSGQVTSIRLEPARSPVLGLASTPTGLLATTGDGFLFSLDATGRVLWRTEGLGDVVGAPAEAGTLAACSDRQGRILLFDRQSGQPRGQVLADSEPVGGLLAVQGLIVACLADGRLFVHDAEAGRPVADVPFSGSEARFPPTRLSGDRVVLPARGCCLALLPVSALVPPPPEAPR